MSYRHHRQFRQNSPCRSRRKASGIEAKPNRRFRSRISLRPETTSIGPGLSTPETPCTRLFGLFFTGKLEIRTPPTILCPELYAQPPSDGAKTRNLTQKESRPRGALHRQETPRMSNRFSRGSAQTFADHNPDDPIVVEVVITSFTPVRGASHSATCAAQPPTPPRSTVTPVIA